MATKIEYADETVNPFGWGCYGPYGTKENPKPCEYCFAHKFAKRHLNKCDKCNSFESHWHPEELNKPLQWKRGRVIFWQDMGDMFHPCNDYKYIDAVMDVVVRTPQHIHLMLTKCPTNMNKYFTQWMLTNGGDLPDNLWRGTTVENKSLLYRADELRKVYPAKNLFLSLEPLQTPVYIGYLLDTFKWIIAGGGTGPKSKPMHPQWPDDIRIQCQNAGIPFFFKGFGNWGLDSKSETLVDIQGNVSKRVMPGEEHQQTGVKFMSKEKSGRLLSGEIRAEVPWTNFFISKK